MGAASTAGYMANHADLSATYPGLTFGLANTCATVPGLVAGPLTAALIKATGGWTTVFCLAAAINVCCATAYWRLAKAHRVL